MSRCSIASRAAASSATVRTSNAATSSSARGTAARAVSTSPTAWSGPATAIGTARGPMLACGHANASNIRACNTTTPVTTAIALRVGDRVCIGLSRLRERLFALAGNSMPRPWCSCQERMFVLRSLSMPRVSEAHRERRREQILDAARRCFIRKGFHQSSMQDVFAESGLSAGAVYRYFKSKDELVAALASDAGTDIRAVLIE